MVLKAKSILTVLLLTLFVPLFSYSQVYEEFEVDKEGTEEDGKKETNINPAVGTWQISEYGAFQDSMKLDTLLDNFQIYYPVFINSLTSTFVGNYGTPAINNDFFKSATSR